MSKNIPKLIFWSLLPILATSNALLIRQNWQMRAALEGFKPAHLQAGDFVPSFSAQKLNGENVGISYSAGSTTRIFLFFSPDCSYCHKQFPLWKELLDKVDLNRFSIIGLAMQSEKTEKVGEYLHSVGCRDLPVIMLSQDIAKSYGLSVTPMTLVVSGEGKIERVWRGQWSSEDEKAASSLLGISRDN